jgi:4-hydroxyproline epimerase
MPNSSKKITVIDSHTGGEPTRLIVAGGPELGAASLQERANIFQQNFDHYRAALVGEPRGSDVMVGALDCAPGDPTCAGAVIFFNNVGMLGMCGHGMMGYIASLAYQGRLAVGVHRIETPVGVVNTELHGDGSVTVHNVPAYRYRQKITLKGVNTAPFQQISGDIAWGGNWFFLVSEHGQDLRLSNVETLTEFCWQIRLSLQAQGITGANGAEIDHIELFSKSANPGNHSRNFVLCPGKAYDRSPCGTGTSAKLACLAADQLLPEHQTWRQESIIGSVFEGCYQWHTDSDQHAELTDVISRKIMPSIKGRAFVNGEAVLLIQADDPFAWGIR